jgi:rhamnogalacturonyl hydrolase YesR
MTDKTGELDDLDGVIEPVLNGERDLFGENPGSSTIGGIIWAYDLATIKKDMRAEELLVRTAEYFSGNGNGLSPECTDPSFRVEDMFNCNAILGRAYALTGDPKYLDIMSEFLLSADTQQQDGLFIHARGVPYYWGRGNGFAAMGFAETLTYMPEDHRNRSSLLEIHIRHLGSLRNLQQASGMYWQILDLPGSYQEFTCTCMVGYSMAKGVRLGWLDSSFVNSIELAWQGVAERIDDDGNIVDACISTGVQSSVQEYLDREAICGRDDRSGSIALWFAVEMKLLKDSLSKGD